MVAAKLPFSLTEYYPPDVPWHDFFTEFVGPEPYPTSSASYATGRVYRTGQVSHERWNAAVFGPSFAPYDTV
ncbi:MAG: hypothetical protein LC635_03085, partial [Pseudonocardiaceae bacterium]|nr:hypothetical protein [Pseudonocardiaceae bacterium]